MKRIIALLLTIVLFWQALPAPVARAEAGTAVPASVSLWQELETYGSVDAAMDAYAQRQLRFYQGTFDKLSYPGLLAFRSMADRFRTDGGTVLDGIAQVMLNLGYTYAENDGSWRLKEQQVGLFIKYLMMLAEMDTMTFEEAAERARAGVPQRNRVADALDGTLTFLLKGYDELLSGYVSVGKAMCDSGELLKDSKFVFQVIDSWGKVKNGMDVLESVQYLLDDTSSLPQVLDAQQRLSSGRALLDLVSAESSAELLDAWVALNQTFLEFEDELAQLSGDVNGRRKLEDAEYLDRRFNELLSQNTSPYLADTLMTVLETGGRIADVFLNGGWASFIVQGSMFIGEEMLGTKTSYSYLHAIMTVDEIYRDLEKAQFDMSDWEQCVLYAQNMRRLSVLAMLGETHVYTLNTQNPGAIVEFSRLVNKQSLVDTENWYRLVSASLEEVSMAAEEYVDDLMAHYAALQEALMDVSALLGHEDESMGVLSGRLIKDKWFAMADGSNNPDKDHPNPEAGEPVKNTTVQLKCGELVLATTQTDDDGWYHFTYPRSMATGQLLIVVDPERKEYATLEAAGPVYSDVTMPSYYRWDADREAPVESDAAVVQSLPYADDYFLDPAYSHDLALASIGLSAAANDQSMITAAFGQMGFSITDMGGYDVPANMLEASVPYVVATKTFEDPDARDDEPKTYRIVAVCAGNPLETAALAQAIAEGGMLNAREAAKPVARAMAKAIRDKAGEDEDVRLWLMGFSYGGNVVDSAYAQIMLEDGVMGEYKMAGVYTFGAPGGQVVQSYNFVYTQDPVGLGLTKPSEKTIPFGAEGVEDARRRIASHFHELTKGYTHYDPASYHNDAALPAILRETSLPQEDLGAMLYAISAWRMLEGEGGSDFRLTDLAARHEAAQDLARTTRSAEEMAHKAMASLTLPVFRAMPVEIEQEMMTILTDIAAIYLKAGGNATEDMCLNMLPLMMAVWEDLGNPTSRSSSLFAHHPEMYLAWLLGKDGESLTGNPEPEVFGARVLQLPFNIQGTVINEDTLNPLPNVSVTITGEGETLRLSTDENGYWKALVKPGSHRLTFEQPGFETEEETAEIPQTVTDVEMRYTYMRKKEIPTLIITTDNQQQHSSDYFIDIGRPKVWSSLNEHFTQQFDDAIAFIYQDQAEDISYTKGGCSYHPDQKKQLTIRPHRIYSNGNILSLYMADSYYDCCIGHDVSLIHGFTFDVATGKVLMLNDLLDPENPNAEKELIAVIGAVDEYYAQIPSKIYTHLLKPESNRSKYASWSLYQDGLHLSVDNLNLGVLPISGTTIPYEKLEGILDKRFLPVDPVGEADVSFAGSGAQGYQALSCTPEGQTTVQVKGLLNQLWIVRHASGTHGEYSDRFRYFYAYGLDDAVITLPECRLGADFDGFDVQWEDSAGIHHLCSEQ